MPILHYENLNYAELATLPRDKSVVFIPVGPLEQHGPHLPLSVDTVIATYFSKTMAERLSYGKSDWNYILFPTIHAGSDALDHIGTINISPMTLRQLLSSCCSKLAKDGFKNLILVGAHGGPRHMVVLEEVAERIAWRYRARVVSPTGRILSDLIRGRFTEKIDLKLKRKGQGLSPEDRQALSKDFHGGMLETSLMLAISPDLVHEVHKTLRPAVIDKFWKIKKNSLRKVGDGVGYLGYPALARKDLGEVFIEAILEETTPLLERFLEGEKLGKKFRSMFYYIPFFRTDFKWIIAIAVYLALFGFAFAMLSRFLMELSR